MRILHRTVFSRSLHFISKLELLYIHKKGQLFKLDELAFFIYFTGTAYAFLISTYCPFDNVK